MTDLGNLLSSNGWLVDADGDGHVDSMELGLVLTEGLGAPIYAAASLLAARMGLETAGLDLPICFADTDQVTKSWRVIFGQGNRRWPAEVSKVKAEYGRIRLVGKDLLVDGDDWQIAQGLTYLAVHYPSVGTATELTLSSLGSELSGVCGGALTCRELHVLATGLRFVFERADGQAINSEVIVWPQGDGNVSLAVEAGRLQATVAADWSMTPLVRTEQASITCLSRLFSVEGIFRDTDGDFLPDDLAGGLPIPGGDLSTMIAQINLAARIGLETLGLTLGLGEHDGSAFGANHASGDPSLCLIDGQVVLQAEPELAPAIWSYLAQAYPETSIGSTWQEILLQLEGWVRQQPLTGEWREVPLGWEVDELRQVWSEILNTVSGPVQAEVRVSEPRQVRAKLQKQLCQLARSAGITDISVAVRSAYKQGLEWIREEIIPELINLSRPVDRCLIRVAPFRPNDGALDPEARWLLELYPVDALLVGALGLAPEQVCFVLDEHLESTYRLQAFAVGECCYERSFTVWHSAVPYLHCLDSKPTVHPPTGGVTWTSPQGNGFKSISTDLERVFQAYQEVILPELVTVAEQVGGLQAEQQPFFERLHLLVEVSEPEERLGVREELLSPADALHEDLHFVGLDLFKRLGEERQQQLRSPGLIFPEVKVRAGQAPRLAYRLTPRSETSSISRPTLDRITFDRHGAVQGGHLLWSADSEFTAKLIVDALQQRGGGDKGLRLAVQVNYPTGVLTTECRVESSAVVADADSVGVIYLEQCQARLAELSGRPGVKVETAGVSRQGRPIYAALLTSPGGGHLVSSAKMTGWKPTYMLNNRHHANEVSSTGAALDLLDQLVAGPEGQEILRSINVVAIPLENVDGAALHQQLAAENPNHKFHAARFNSLGREFADSYFQDDQRVPEARAFTDIWRKYVPDIVADNHGIPSHEWEQPFSGYLCPWFTSFWIPRSLFYAYFWYVDDPAYSSRQVAEALEGAISLGLRDQPAIHQRNQELLSSWRKYFLPYLPDHFSGEEREGLMWYYVPYGPDPSRRFASHRYPQLTVLDYTTEVADETAQGEYLALCSDTHRLAQLACLKWLARQPVEFESSDRLVSNASRYRCRRRRRPLVI